MRLVAELARAARRRSDMPPFGFVRTGIGFLIVLNRKGGVVCVEDVRTEMGKRKVPMAIECAMTWSRSSNVEPGFLVDNTGYVLGDAGGGKSAKDAEKFGAFRDRNLEVIGDDADPGLVAIRRFLRSWEPVRVLELDVPEDFLGSKVTFALEPDKGGKLVPISDSPAARALTSKAVVDPDWDVMACLVTGEKVAIPPKHPKVRGVTGAQEAGASLVSFGKSSFDLDWQERMGNAPISAKTAHGYVSALNTFLDKSSGHRRQLGDMSVVFWAEHDDPAKERSAERVFREIVTAPPFWDPVDDPEDGYPEAFASFLGGMSFEDAFPDVDPDTRFLVAGLAPNAARIFARFAFEGTVGQLAGNYFRFAREVALRSAKGPELLGLSRYLDVMAFMRKSKHVDPHLAGDMVEAVLVGRDYPETAMTALLDRIGDDGIVGMAEAGLMKAWLARNREKGFEMELDERNEDVAYLLGRLFAVYEAVETASYGKAPQVGIRDRYYTATSCRPRSGFGGMEKELTAGLSRISGSRKNPGMRALFERQVDDLVSRIGKNGKPFPVFLTTEGRACFGLGYHHQREKTRMKIIAAAEAKAVAKGDAAEKGN